MLKRALVAAGLLAGALVVSAPHAAQGEEAFSGTMLVPSGGATAFAPSPSGDGTISQIEVKPRPPHAGDGGLADANPGGSVVFPPAPLSPPHVKSSKIAGSNPEVALAFEGLNLRDQRLANNGNQFTVEPPDQALCVGNGYVLEATNSVLQVFDTSGNPLTGVQDINTFYGYIAAIDRTTFTFGPNVIDPICAFDPDTGRFIVVITTLGSDLAGNFTGKNTIDVAVSNTGDPTGSWTVYYIPAQNDGADGTPDHGCTLDGVNPGPCFQDYPHIGLDAYGVYISTNEYDLFGPSYNAAQVYAISKAKLAATPAVLPVTLVENLMLDGTPGFTVWPALSPAGEYEMDNNGTEYMLSTIAGDGSETGNPTGTAKQIGVWALTNTQSLDTATPSLNLLTDVVKSRKYVFPPLSDQKPGPTPLADCINDTTTPTIFGDGCWQLFFFGEPAHDEVESTPDSGDTRMQQTWYVDGRIWGAAGTAVDVKQDVKAGIVWFGVDVEVDCDGDHGKGKKSKNDGDDDDDGGGQCVEELDAKVKKSGYIALEDNNLTYPAIAMTPEGDGAIAFTVMGEDYFPSAGYVTITDKGKVGKIHIVGEGLGPDDGFTSYKSFVGDPPRTRWGDYGAAVTDGDSIWLASEWIAQTCTYAEYYPFPSDVFPDSLVDFGSCGATRTSLANWSTHLTRLDF